jgi:hypothetical protein
MVLAFFAGTFFVEVRLRRTYYPPAPPGEKGKVPLPLLAQLSLLSAFGLRMTPFIKMSLRADTFYALRIVSAIC